MDPYFTELSFFNETSTYSPTTFKYDNENVPDESFAFIFVPFAVLATVFVLSAMVYLMIRHRRTYRRRERRVPYFTFDSPETSDEEHQSETDRILNPRRDPRSFYKSFEITEFNKKYDLYTLKE